MKIQTLRFKNQSKTQKISTYSVQKKKREREKPGTSSIGKVRVRLVVDDVVVFFEVRRLNVVHDLKNWV